MMLSKFYTIELNLIFSFVKRGIDYRNEIYGLNGSCWLLTKGGVKGGVRLLLANIYPVSTPAF